MSKASIERNIDWERVEAEYRRGVLTLREIAEAVGCTHGAVNKRAKAEGWTRDLRAKVNAKADELVSKAAVSKSVSKARLVTDSVIIQNDAHVQATVRLKHRAAIGQAEILLAKMYAELDVHTDHPDTYEKLVELVTNNPFDTPETEDGRKRMAELQARRIAALEAALSLPERSKTMKALTETLQRIVGLEREAYGIGPVKSDDQPPGPAPDAAKDARAHYQWLADQRPKG